MTDDVTNELRELGIELKAETFAQAALNYLDQAAIHSRRCRTCEVAFNSKGHMPCGQGVYYISRYKAHLLALKRLRKAS